MSDSGFCVLQQYLQNRMNTLALLKERGLNPYPHKFYISVSVTEFVSKYGSLSSGEHVESIEVSLAGT